MLICAKTEVLAHSTVMITNAYARQDTMGSIVRKGPAMKILPTLMAHLPTQMAFVTRMAHVRIYYH